MTASRLQHSSELVTRLFDEELAKNSEGLAGRDRSQSLDDLPEARRIAEQMIVQGHHSPI